MLTWVLRLRRMTAEPDNTVYEDADLEAIILRYPLLDADGRSPSDEDWTPTYDIHAAAADVWEEKAAQVAVDFDFAADGANFHRSQVHIQYLALVRYHRMRRAAKSMTLVAWPKETNTSSMPWIGNLPEPED